MSLGENYEEKGAPPKPRPTPKPIKKSKTQ